MVAVGGWIMTRRLGNKQQLTHQGDGTHRSQDYRLQQCSVKQAHSEHVACSAVERIAAAHSMPYHTSTHYHYALHLISDRQVANQTMEWKSANPGTRVHAYSQGDVGSGMYAPGASYHIKLGDCPKTLNQRPQVQLT